MKNNSKSKVTGGLNAGDEKQQSAMQSTNEGRRSSISDTSVSSPSLKNQIGFQPTQALGEVDEVTANVQVLLAFADKLGTLVEWRRLELGDGQEVVALCFALGTWEITPNGTLGITKAS